MPERAGRSGGHNNAVSAEQVTLVFEPGAGAGVALGVPGQPTADRLAVDRATIGRQAAQQRPVMIAWMCNLCGGLGAVPETGLRDSSVAVRPPRRYGWSIGP
jgi:hypothetical protein